MVGVGGALGEDYVVGLWRWCWESYSLGGGCGRKMWVLYGKWTWRVSMRGLAQSCSV